MSIYITISREAGTRDNRFFREQSEGLSDVEADGARYIPYLGKAKLVANRYVERVRRSALGNDINNNIYPGGATRFNDEQIDCFLENSCCKDVFRKG